MTYKNRVKQRNSQDFVIKTETGLLEFLCTEMNRNKAKVLLKNKQIAVNGQVTNQYNLSLIPGDKVTINHHTQTNEKRFRDISLVYEDDDIIVIDKHAGLLSISTAKENSKTAFRILSSYVKRQDPSNKIFIVHRLDRETSGLMVFAKSQKVKKLFQDNWKELVYERSYMAVVHGKPEPWSGTLKHYLYESKALKVYVTEDPEGSQEAITHYKTIKSKKQFSLLKLWLDTGRKNQIRVQLNEIGHPIVGDQKYGRDGEEDLINRLALHAAVLNFKHPVTGQDMKFQSDLPRKFSRLIG